MKKWLPILVLAAAAVPAGAMPVFDKANYSQNLLSAARALKQDGKVAIVLKKNLPVAAGLGGGSADAAAALRGLNAFWNLARSETELLAIARDLGSDVPACVLSRPAWMSGRYSALDSSWSLALITYD